MPLYDKSEIEAARSVDLLAYLQTREPGSVRRSGPHEYCLAEHDSLKISNGKWFWFSRGVGSNNALDFLVQVRGLNFTEAVRTLLDGNASYDAARWTPPPPKPRKPFALPEPHRDNYRAIAYLMGRGIDRPVIDLCIKAGSLYESKERHNCVFVGFDGEKPRFACQRGTFGSFKLDVEGSDKRFSFANPAARESNAVNVFESPIDALSFASMERANWGGGSEWQVEHYLSLSGVASRALLQYLTDHPEINDVRLRLDNDAPGIEAMIRIKDELAAHPEFSGHRVMTEASPIGKDWNEMLQFLKTQERAEKLTSRAKDAAISM